MRPHRSSHSANFHAPQPVAQRQHRGPGEPRVRAVARLQPVIRHSRRHVVHMMKADIPGCPLQPPRQPQERSAAQCRLHGAPLCMARPQRAVEMVLYRKQPTRRRVLAGTITDSITAAVAPKPTSIPSPPYIASSDRFVRYTPRRSAHQPSGVSNGNRYSTRKISGAAPAGSLRDVSRPGTPPLPGRQRMVFLHRQARRIDIQPAPNAAIQIVPRPMVLRMLRRHWLYGVIVSRPQHRPASRWQRAMPGTIRARNRAG